MQFLCQNLEDAFSPKSFSSSQVKLTEPKCFSLNKFHIWQYLPIVPQLLGGLYFRCFLTFYPASLYDIWPYMFSFCKYSRGISIDRNNLCVHVHVCIYTYIYLYINRCISLRCVCTHTNTHQSYTPENSGGVNSAWKTSVQELHLFSEKWHGNLSFSQASSSCKWLTRTQYLLNRV